MEKPDRAAERFGLDWPGKRAARLLAGAPTGRSFEPVPHESDAFGTTGNLLIEADNLDALKLLQGTHAGRVALIYVDPPYNTGNELLYADNLSHAGWLSMMYPRLELARKLLTLDGAIFVSIGDTEHANLRLVLGEVFGEQNFIASIARVTKRSSNNGTHVSPSKDHVLVYARDASLLPGFSVPLSEAQIRTFNREDARGRYKEIGLYQAALKHGGSRYPIECPDGSLVVPPGSVPWRWGRPRFEAGLADDLVVFKRTTTSPLLDPATGGRSPWNVYTKLHLAGRMADGLVPKDFIEDLQNSLATRELKELGIPFDFAKPAALIQYLLGLVENRDALVLDFFAGSGSTAQAVFQLNAADGGNRRFVLVQLPEPCAPRSAAAQQGYRTIADICKERVRRAGRAVVAGEVHPDWKQDTGFQVLRVL